MHPIEELPGWPDRAIAALAARQRTMLTHDQLQELGVSAAAIRRAIRRGRLYRVHHGVVSLVASPGRPELGTEQAALLACGPGALLSHATAAPSTPTASATTGSSPTAGRSST